MEVSGKIIQVLPEQGGVSKTSGKEWKLQAYVLETQEQYPKKVHFEVFGEDRIKANPCQLDDIVTVSFDIESREFNGRWYTSIRAWKIQQGVVEATGVLEVGKSFCRHRFIIRLPSCQTKVLQKQVFCN